MTNPKNGTVEGGERSPSPRRRPPTIDLEATEIAGDPSPQPAVEDALLRGPDEQGADSARLQRPVDG